MTSIKNRLPYREWFWFGCVGGCASLVNFVVVILLVHFEILEPLWANVLAFAVAYQVSFFGHHYLTFRKKTSCPREAWLKFFSVAVGSFFLNEMLYGFFLKILDLNYIVALLLVFLIVPGVTYLLGKYWAFR